MRRDKLDAIFSTLIRCRDGYTCQWCGKSYPENHAGLHASHHFTRSRKRTRWTPLNAAALCYSCHLKFGANPYESAAWLAEYLGEDKMEELASMQREVIKMNPKVKELIYGVLKEDRARQMDDPKTDLRDPVSVLRETGLL